MPDKPKISARALVLALGGALAALNTAAAQDKPVELRFSLWVPPTHANVVSAKEWGDSITKASNGSIKVSLFPAQQLGKAQDHFDMARDGIADVTYISLGYEPGRLPIAGISQVPFLMSDAKAGSRVFDAWYRGYTDKDMPEVKYCLGYAHDPGTLHAKKQIDTPDQIKGMKIRPAHATMARFVTSLGGSNVQASAPESREILERGVADAITFPWQSILLFGIDKAVKYHMDVPLYVSTFAWIVNKKKYDDMSPAQKAVIDAHCNNEWAGRVADAWADQEFAGRAKMASLPGHTVYKLTPEQVGLWRKAAEPLTKDWHDAAGKAGIDAAKAYKDLTEALKKNGSLF